MKKLLSILLIGTFISVTSNNIISCFGFGSNSKITNKEINTSLIPSTNSRSWYSNIKAAVNLTLINNKQLTISGVDNGSPISDVNLDFSGNHNLDDFCAGAANYIYYFNHMYFVSRHICAAKIRHYTLDSADANGNYFTYKDGTDIDAIPDSTRTIMSSNNKLFTISSDNYNAWDISDPTNAINLTSGLSENANYIYDYNNILYVGTVNGLYKSDNEGASYNLVKNTEGLNITSIIGSEDKQLIFFGTQKNGLWSFSTISESPRELSKTKDKQINQNSLFITDNNLYFGIKDEGLYILNNLSTTSINHLVGSDVTETDNVKSIVETDAKQKILLTDKNIVLF